jgi:hypothetical protein
VSAQPLVYRYLREALDLLAEMAPTLQHVIELARGKASVILEGTRLRLDRVGMTGGRDRPYHSGGTQVPLRPYGKVSDGRIESSSEMLAANSWRARVMERNCPCGYFT